MLLAKKVKLKPTDKQVSLFKQSAGVARWAFNAFLAENERLYQTYLDNEKTGTKSISETAFRKYVNRDLKPSTHI